MGTDTASWGPPDRPNHQPRQQRLGSPREAPSANSSIASSSVIGVPSRYAVHVSQSGAQRLRLRRNIQRSEFAHNSRRPPFATDASASSASSASSIARTNAIVFIADTEADLRLGASCGCKFEGPWSDTVCCPEGRSWPEKIVKQCPAPSRPMNWRRPPDPREFRASFGAARTSIH